MCTRSVDQRLVHKMSSRPLKLIPTSNKIKYKYRMFLFHSNQNKSNKRYVSWSATTYYRKFHLNISITVNTHLLSRHVVVYSLCYWSSLSAPPVWTQMNKRISSKSIGQAARHQYLDIHLTPLMATSPNYIAALQWTEDADLSHWRRGHFPRACGPVRSITASQVQSFE